MNTLYQGDNLEITPLPDKKYSVIYADPPWKYPGGAIRNGNGIGETKVEDHYPCMSIDEVASLPVQQISNENCLLFLWAVSPQLPSALQVGQSWGFQYITVGFCWDKQRALPGRYTMSVVELCLIFRKGKIPQPRGKRDIRQLLSVKKGKHSVKPYEVRDRITEMFPHHEKIELFARERFDGWDAWGNEV